MSDPREHWNSADGPPPTAEDLADARALLNAIANGPVAARRDREPETLSLLDVALRVQATAHPDALRTDAVAAAAVEHALNHPTPARWYRSRWRWLTLVVSATLLATGAQIVLLHSRREQPATPITHSAADVFTTPFGPDPRSGPIEQLSNARMRMYRDAMFLGRGATRRAP